jgi:cysteine-rich repeat protein
MKPYFLLAFGAGVFSMACQPDLGTSVATGGAANADGGSSSESGGSSSGGRQSTGGMVGQGGIANNTWAVGGFGGGGSSNLGGGTNDLIPPICTPGSVESCICPGGLLGEQTCDSKGLGYDACNCTPICGNGLLEAGETCDDGNQVDDDGCQADCQIPG